MTHDDSNIKFPNLHEKAVKNFLNYFQIMLILNGYVYLVVDPHSDSARHVESLEYQYLGAVGELDKHNNLSRTRARPQMPEQPARKTSLVEIVYNQVKEDLDITEEIPS